jgi:PTS system fructose-specific IIC component
MLKLAELLTPDAILLNLKSHEKIATIKELAQPLIDHGLIRDEDEFFAAILKRENLESTGIGYGVAIPHARTRAVSQLLLAFGRSDVGVDFSALDNKPSHFIFLIAAPEEKKSEYIFTLARLSKLLRRPELREKLMTVQSPEEVLSLLAEAEA